MADAERPGAQEWVPEGAGIPELRTAAEACRGCELWQDATQVVFSDGSVSARMVLVGEQPGDREDIEGEPFVGPAGRILSEALEAAGIDREGVYLTNAVKHFRFERRGKRRIHEKPGVAHVEACAPWLEAELRAVRPAVAVALGATAARALLQRPVRIGETRGQVIEGADPQGTPVLVTVHPASLLRLRDQQDRAAAFQAFVGDLERARELIG